MCGVFLDLLNVSGRCVASVQVLLVGAGAPPPRCCQEEEEENLKSLHQFSVPDHTDV